MPDELVEALPKPLSVQDQAETARILQLFEPLYADWTPEGMFPHARPLLAHYTSVQTLEQVLKNGEIWLSNPLFMNDTQELRFGIHEGVSRFRMSAPALRDACGGEDRFRSIVEHFEGYAGKFMNEDALDVYVFCLSELPAANRDGKLSMWRGYGADGNGAAIVFDTAKVPAVEGSPLRLARVQYEDFDRQRQLLQGYIDQFIHIVGANEISPAYCYLAAWNLFRRIKYFSVLTKHEGFREESEWRLIYAPSLDDADSPLTHLIDYWIGPRGVEPKLKLKLEPLPGVISADMDFPSIVDKIILGPTISNPLSHASVTKMLRRLGRDALVDRLYVSNIPFRSLNR
jgi:hypothetical protein